MDGRFFVCQSYPEHPYGKEGGSRHQHCIAHRGGGSGSQVYAVPGKGGAADGWHKQQPGQVAVAGFHDACVVCHKFQQQFVEAAVYAYEQDGYGHAPGEDQPDRAPQGGFVAGAYVFAAHCLAGIREAVGEVGEEQQHFHQYGGGGEGDVAVAGRDEGISYIYSYETEGTYDQVGVHAEEAAGRGVAEEAAETAALVGAEYLAVAQQQEGAGADESAVLGQNGAAGYAFEAYEAAQDYAAGYVPAVDDQVAAHRCDAVLHAYEPALESHQGECGWSRPYPYEEVAAGQAAHFGAAVYQEEGPFDEEPLYGQQQQGGGGGDDQGALEHSCALSQVALPVGLGREPARAAAQEGEVPVEQVEKGRAEGYCGNEGGGAGTGFQTVQMPGNGYVHHSHQGDGDVGEYARQGESENLSVHLPVFAFVDVLEHSQVGVVALAAYASVLEGGLYRAAGLVGVGAGGEAAVFRGPEHFWEIERNLLLFEVHQAEAAYAGSVYDFPFGS